MLQHILLERRVLLLLYRRNQMLALAKIKLWACQHSGIFTQHWQTYDAEYNILLYYYAELNCISLERIVLVVSCVVMHIKTWKFYSDEQNKPTICPFLKQTEVILRRQNIPLKCRQPLELLMYIGKGFRSFNAENLGCAGQSAAK